MSSITGVTRSRMAGQIRLEPRFHTHTRACMCICSRLWRPEVTCAFNTEAPLPSQFLQPKLWLLLWLHHVTWKHHSRMLRTGTSTQLWHFTLGVFRGRSDPSLVLSLQQSWEASPTYLGSSGPKSALFVAGSVTSQPRTTAPSPP